ncbi:lipoate--protein ligase [Vibrio vulnificus]|uniref:lipoate--protein ligase family protein n=1 Tax=Vibrio vulnificus TaxID=672 RepID=UPI001CDC5CF7|nr:lipoate--protein ligase [Vibrio vulnificus]MCA3938744.1 lipoate--protein ligase [Vibrio vulnificus]
MSKRNIVATKNRLIRYLSIDAETLFKREEALIKQVQAGELDQVLLLWQVKHPTLVLPAGNKWPQTEHLRAELAELGWKLTARKTGGAPVPQVPGIINLSHLYHWPQDQAYDIRSAYLKLCDTLRGFFQQFGLEADVHATPGSYCDGDYNLNIAGQKIVGTAQRVLLKKSGGQIILAQACLLIDADMAEIIKPVQLCNQLSNHNAEILADVHTPLFEHIEQRPSIDRLFQSLSDAFVRQVKS